MELKTYLSILLKKWWIIVPTFLISVTTATYIAYTTTPTYEAKATFVVAPLSNTGSARDYTTILNILSNREEILTTYTEVASSNKVKRMAADSIDLERLRGYTVISDLVKGSNIIHITATGPNPETVSNLANAVGAVTREQVAELYQVYVVNVLDEATVPNRPISPNRPRDIALAAVLGLVIGGSIAYLVSYLESADEGLVAINIIDNKTGVYTKEFFLQRLGEEMLRAKRNHYPLSIALMRVDNLSLVKGFNASRMRNEALQYAGLLIKRHLREEDVVAYVGQDTFAFLLLDTPGQQAQSIMEYLQTRIAWAPFQSKTGNIKLNLDSLVGIASYNHNGSNRNQFMELATQALQQAEINENGRVYLSSLEETE